MVASANDKSYATNYRSMIVLMLTQLVAGILLASRGLTLIKFRRQRESDSTGGSATSLQQEPERVPADSDNTDEPADSANVGPRQALDEAERARSIGTTLNAHAALVVTIVTALAVAIRLHSVARGNSLTVHALIGSRSAPDILMGTLAPVIPTLMLAVVLLSSSVIFRVIVDELETTSKAPSHLVGINLVNVAIMVGALMLDDEMRAVTSGDSVATLGNLTFIKQLGLAAIGFTVLAFAMTLWVAVHDVAAVGLALRFRPAFSTLILIAFVIFALPVFDDRPWLPSEKIVADDTVHVGYVIDESEDELLIMRDRDRIVERVPVSTISDRGFCTFEIAAKREADHDSCG